MDTAGDKTRFISSITDTISLFCKLALKREHKFKLDGCLAVTVDDDKTVVVNLNQTVLGGNAKSVYPSLGLLGKDGQNYMLLKDNSTPASYPSTSITRSGSKQPNPVIAGQGGNPQQQPANCTDGSSQYSKLANPPGSPPLIKIGKRTTTSLPTVQHLVTTDTTQQRKVPSTSQPQVNIVQRAIVPIRSLLTPQGEGVNTAPPKLITTPINHSQVKVLTSKGTAHLLIASPKGSPSSQQKSAPIFVISPRKDQPAVSCMQSLITGKRIIQTPTTIAPDTSPIPQSSTTDQSNMGSRINVLQTRALGVQPSDSMDIKSEPDDQPYDESEHVSRHITQFFSGELGEEMTQDKENSTGGNSRRGSTHTDGPPLKRQRTFSSASGVETQKTKADASEMDTYSRLSSNCKVLETKAIDKDMSGTESDHLENSLTEDFSDEEDEDDAFSTATSEDEIVELYQCSEEFARDCTERIESLKEMQKCLEKKMSKKDCTKDIKSKYTRTSNTFDRTIQDFETAKSRGCSDIKSKEMKLQKDFDSVLENFEKLKQMLKSCSASTRKLKLSGNSKSKRGRKPTVKPKVTSSALKHTKKVLKNVKAKAKAAAEEKTHRANKTCGECASCKKAMDCGKCKFCKDKPKYGGSNTLRQKCLKRQCVKKGGFIVQNNGKKLTARPRQET